MKSYRLLILIVFLVFAFWYLYRHTNKPVYTEIKGNTMGTYYSIIYSSKDNFQPAIDSLLNYYSSACNTYDSTSELSEFNRTGNVVFRSPFLPSMLKKAKEINQRTNGVFEPTLMPLINAWGFGFSNRKAMDKNSVDSLLRFVSMEHIYFDDQQLETKKKGVMLDLSAMGEGYAIDLISQFLTSKQVKNYKVEIGGEVFCKGLSPSERKWRIGIENPLQYEKDVNRLLSIVELQNEALSTSGNYRKFIVDKEGNKQPHIIDPTTGYPVQHGLLSVSIKAKDCVTADAFATACMVLGLEGARKLIANNPGLEGYFIYNENNELKIWKSKGFKILN